MPTEERDLPKPFADNGSRFTCFGFFSSMLESSTTIEITLAIPEMVVKSIRMMEGTRTIKWLASVHNEKVFKAVGYLFTTGLWSLVDDWVLEAFDAGRSLAVLIQLSLRSLERSRRRSPSSDAEPGHSSQRTA